MSYLGYVYFALHGGRVKIGYSKNVENRLRDISVHLPEKLELLGAFPGDCSLERAIHRKLKKFLIRNEWFHDCNEVRAALAELQQHNPEVGSPTLTLPEPPPPPAFSSWAHAGDVLTYKIEPLIDYAAAHKDDRAHAAHLRAVLGDYISQLKHTMIAAGYRIPPEMEAYP